MILSISPEFHQATACKPFADFEVPRVVEAIESRPILFPMELYISSKRSMCLIFFKSKGAYF
jgi:hypothetical protein